MHNSLHIVTLYCSGAVPPGARFSPFGPPDVDPMRRFPHRPGNDHLPPPGYNDMFM